MGDATVQQGKWATYPVCKPSGIEWLGDVPEHWEVLAIKRLSSIKRGASPRPIDDPKYFDDDAPYSWVRIADVTASERYLERTTQRLSSLGKSLSVPLEPGELFLSIAGSVGKPIITQIKCCIHDGFVYFPTYKGGTEFLYYVFASGQPYLGLGKLGTQLNLNTDTVGSIHIGYPCFVERKAIAAFLDRETGRIDGLIAKKQRQIELFAEKRSALISRAVTKGLDPNAPMKPSGIDWLGDVPDHWKVMSLRRILRVSSGDMTSASDFIDAGYPVFGGNGFRGYIDRWNTEPNTIIIGRYGALCGNVRVTNERIWATEHAFRVIPLARFHARFLASVIETLDLNKFSARTAQPGLNSDMVRNNTVGMPPLAEQQAIVDVLASETARIDGLIAKVRYSIEKLQEYRTALISAAVTGKIDVRETIS